MAEKPSNRQRCPKCGSTLVYVRVKSKELVCRSCLTITPLEEVDKRRSS